MVNFSSITFAELFPHSALAKEKKEYYHQKFEGELSLPILPELSMSEDFTRVMTYNVHEFKDAFHQNRKKEIVDLIGRSDASIVALQEATFNNWSTLDGLKGVFAYSKYVQTETHGSTIIGNVLLSKYRIGETRVIEPYPNRQIIISEIFFPGDQAVHVAVAHLDNNGYGHRESLEQVHELLQDMKTDQDGPSFFLGDFNALYEKDPNLQVIREIDESLYRDTYVLRDRVLGPHGWISSYDQSSYPQYTCWSGRTVDHVFFKPGRHTLYGKSFVLPVNYSDHLPVVFDYRMRAH